MTKVIVTHPGLQHSHQLALALYERSILAAFWSGTPVCERASEIPFFIPKRYSSKIKTIPLPASYRRNLIWSQLFLKLTPFVGRFIPKSDYQHHIFHLFDYYVSKQLPKTHCDAVVAYENSAYHTFMVAKRLGIKCILDAPSLHNRKAAELMPVEKTPYLKEINRRKNIEIELADKIICCSDYAAGSYIENGISKSKVISIELGANVDIFDDVLVRNDSITRFIFAGALRKLKSIDIILSAFERLHSEGFEFFLDFVGGCEDQTYIRQIENLSFATYRSNLPQRKLFDLFRHSDCLLLPSRIDSFGMVVAEAMACGIPAIVSTQTGSKSIIEKYPGSGWIIEPTENSLYACVKYLLSNKDKIEEAKMCAMHASSFYTWENYRRKVSSAIEEFMS